MLPPTQFAACYASKAFWYGLCVRTLSLGAKELGVLLQQPGCGSRRGMAGDGHCLWLQQSADNAYHGSGHMRGNMRPVDARATWVHQERGLDFGLGLGYMLPTLYSNPAVPSSWDCATNEHPTRRMLAGTT